MGRPACSTAVRLLADAVLTGANLINAGMTGVDLRGAAMGFPGGSIWDKETRWPLRWATLVSMVSKQVGPGTYQVRGGGGRRTPYRA
ncbi:pentapeptide repeat-containing protein [Streptomyces sp. NPDC003247]|uniref:pentapeptide repeat-containing protein n=1 Tax=Streptomyces sp. NPDC003247 TaxID=3364677 RepID=UPI0036ACEBC3